MEITDLITKIEEIEKLCSYEDHMKDEKANTFYLLSLQFVRNYIGIDTEFYNALKKYPKRYADESYEKNIVTNSVLSSIKEYLNLNLELGKSHTYNIKVDIISDFLNQAINLANDKKFHPAAAAILLGASLEEFLKQISEEKKRI